MAVAVVPVVAQAADRYYIGPNGGSWSDTANWSATPGGAGGASVPVAGDGAMLTQSVSNDVSFDGEYAAPLSYLWVDGAGGATMMLTQPATSMMAQVEFVGFYGQGGYTQEGGTNATQELTLALDAGSTGTYSLSYTGSLASQVTNVGRSGTGTFHQSGGTHTVGNGLDVGSITGSSGTYNLSGSGSLTVGGFEYVGRAGTGLFIQTGGTHSVPRLYVGYVSSAIGTYNLSGTGVLGTSEYVYIALHGSGAFNQTGGTHNAGLLYVGYGATGNGSYVLSGGSLGVTEGESIGSSGAGLFKQTGGTHTVRELYVGSNIGSNGTYDLSNGSLTVSQPTFIGLSGTGAFLQTGGTHSTGHSLSLGYSSGSSGSYTLNGGSATVGINLNVGGSDSEAGGTGILTINRGYMQVNGALRVWDTAGTVVNLAGGDLSVGSLITNGNLSPFNWMAGSLSITGSDLTIGSTGPLGPSLTLDATRSLNVTGKTTIDAYRVLTLDGGSFFTGTLDKIGTLNWTSGTLGITGAGGLAIGTGGALGDTVNLVLGQTLKVTYLASVLSSGTLVVGGGRFHANSGVTNNGEISLSGAESRITGGTITNNKLIRGDGRIDANVTNATGGEIRAESGKTLRIVGVNGINSGKINLQGGTLQFGQAITNGAAGLVTGRGFFYADAGLTNNGQIQLSAGTTDVYGTVSASSGSKIIVSGGGTATFFDNVTMSGGSEFRISAGSIGVFFGNVTGTSNFTGSGTKIFEAGTSALSSLDTSGSTVVEAGATLTAGAIRESALTVNGLVTIPQNGTSTSRVGSLSVTGRLDLKDNKLIVTDTPIGSWNGSAYSGVTGLIDSGRGSAASALWDGGGIVTSDARAIGNGDLTSLGVATAGLLGRASFGGLSVAPNDVLVMFTWGGDANLDGRINIDDYGQIDGNVGQSGSVFGWHKGDFNYDGKINIDDYGIIDGNINRQGTPFSTAATSLNVVAVPEPAAAMVALAGLSVHHVGRRRRRRE